MRQTDLRLRLRCAAIAYLLTAAIACGDGSGPTTPSPPATNTPQLFTGSAAFNVVSFEEQCSAKTPAWGFRLPTVLTQASIETEAGGWLARTGDESRFGNMELHFTRGAATATDLVLSGTARGTAIDLLSQLQFPTPTRVVFSGTGPNQSATMNGGVGGLGSGNAAGSISGTLVFTDNQGGVTTCTGGQWFLFPAPR